MTTPQTLIDAEIYFTISIWIIFVTAVFADIVLNGWLLNRLKTTLRFTLMTIEWAIVRPWPMWLLVTACVVSILAFHYFESQRSIRIIGWAWEMFGLGIAAYGFLDLRLAHGLTPLRHQLLAWWKSRPRWLMPISGDIKLSWNLVGNLTSDTSGWFNDNPSQTLEQRLALVIKNTERLRDSLQAQKEQQERVVGDLKVTKDEIKKMEAELRKEIMHIDTDGIGLALIGLAAVAIGFTFNTLTEEVCKILLLSCK